MKEPDPLLVLLLKTFDDDELEKILKSEHPLDDDPFWFHRQLGIESDLMPEDYDRSYLEEQDYSDSE